MYKRIFIIIACMLFAFYAKSIENTITPSGILKNQPDYKNSWLDWLFGSANKSIDFKTNPKIPKDVNSTISSFIQTFSGINSLITTESIVKVYYKNAPHTGLYRKYYPNIYTTIPSIVYSISSDIVIDIEANSKTVLLYYSSEVERCNDEETRCLSINSSLTEEQIFIKALPILEHNNMSVNIDDYKFSFNDYRKVIKNTELWNSTWIVQTANENTEMDKIVLQFSRCSGRLIKLWFFPSQMTIQKWYQYQNSGKDVRHDE